MKLVKTSLLSLFLITSMYAQENITYQKPSQEILELADFERAPSISIDYNKEYMLLTYRSTYKTLMDLNVNEMRLAGLRIDVNTNISSTVTYIENLKVRKVKDTKEVQVKGLPTNPRITNLSWSPDQSKIAFTHTTEKGVELWVVDIKTAQATKLTEDNLNANLGSPITWYKDSKNILVNVIPSNRPALIDTKNTIPAGPIVSVSEGVVSQNRTYQDLLKNKTDEANFETLVTSELYKVNLNGEKTLLKKGDLYVSQSFSPDGEYLMLTTLEKPFSYLVALNRFPMKTIVYDKEGNQVKTVNEIPLSEIMPKGFMATREGKRNMGWRADKAAELYFVEALDGGDPAKEVEYRDEVFTWAAPFDKTPESIVKLSQRYGGIAWGDDNLALVSDQWYDTRNTRTFIINPSKFNENPVKIEDRNSQDVYSDPGEFQTKRNEYGRYVLNIENNKMYLIGDGYTAKGQFPFIDEFDTKTLKTKRLYQSNYTDKKETIQSIEDVKKGTVLVSIQSPTEYPNYYFRNIKKKNDLKAITTFKNPFESLDGVYKEVITYKREDGLELSGTLYLPKGYDRKSKSEKLPLLIWAYPREYKDKNSAGQVTNNPNEFTFPSYGSFVYWVTKGYAVLDKAAFPIVGEGEEEPNDTYVKQLVANGKAAIDAVDALGFIDRSRVGVGGHSYGAFMTANLLTHSDLFAVGIARSGAYNRTLTPFGFQTEQRNYWEVPQVYNTMSPFMNADKMKTPMLLVHGEADNNPGTFTLQTERYFQALKGLGAPVRMVILPKESHGYVAKENILHLLWEQDQFLEKHLKNKK
ncbi:MULTISPECIES: prolyl oligopeptidase family serine peptidase [Myroides]|uniref:Prolyl oligopeptidase family serine peptidase n=1 Tax=Myroides albus TaxID=2562892 RepID=A0A6I3LTJ5_9FLAO|nr:MULTISPECIES: prolyl oligopeptidase family serine peptidase [Myroides]MTG99272.1 prolyl oligopeptidase family serine peptidase [Myroides albus]MVX37096.1 prolyl oligopeptidase family serine peptidase [Myroides sp. LoEW2-1]UVD78853.1 prolyl oligopeptidase family serine peptidase [Myroides albus]